MIPDMRLDLRLVLVTIVPAMGVVVAALVAFRSLTAVGDPLDQFSGERLRTLHAMWIRASCEATPDGVIADIFGTRDTVIFCWNPPASPASHLPVTTLPLTLPAASVPALDVPCATNTPCTSTGSPSATPR